MNARHATSPISTALIASALTLVLSACGNKGPLVLPTQPAPQQAPRAKPGEVPVTISNANDPPVATDPNVGKKSTLPAPPLQSVLPPPAGTKDAEGKDKTQDGETPPDPPVEPTPASSGGQGDG
ncbi:MULTISPECIES: LPS translocon maturation chaperone LptM [Lysobacter]|jgi:predicted small lipoprotein YifL|uniref:Lipoprotein n=1 Tax=Lysobacter gummosus TaxID=262324 RepID=A0ABY3XCF1_9GAMM|nr:MULTISPECIES: lipoprotein [Lysobacter]ALN93417.1 prokaryotic lipoprotein-attachment site family protein [Lysobacter gummosus]UJB19877.1 lipoprotein [Lysobacter capsici]UJQ26397.1 lipoprotein [Lysobacter gummosus]UNP28882.1 lipoprotein [Lysobacter gummosus]